jgi:two-component system sensor histidine kinase HydH
MDAFLGMHGPCLSLNAGRCRIVYKRSQANSPSGGFDEVSSAATWKLVVLAGVISVTLAIHYGWPAHALGVHSSLLMVIHARLCYIPIVIAAVWFGLRGGLLAALLISVFIIPYIVLRAVPAGELATELTEIVFYFAVGSLAGALVERERSQREKTERAHSRLEQAQRLSMMGQMAAGVAHEIKNPLASIKGASEIIAEDIAPDSPKREFLEIVQKETGRLDGTVRTFLEYARPQPFCPSLEKVEEILSSTLKQMEPQIRAASLNLRTDIPDFPERARVDPQKMRQVFINLLLNSVAATPPGGSISVKLQQSGKGQNEFWMISFSDTGEGIAPEDLQRVFEPFFTKRTTGSGLGLAVVRSIVDEHGGTVQVSSEPGRGSTFTVLLPLEKER